MSRFDGDGRKQIKALPQYTRAGTHPIPLRRGTCRILINHFEIKGYSVHSGGGNTLWVIIEHCETNKIPYTVEGNIGLGYHVKRADIEPDGDDKDSVWRPNHETPEGMVAGPLDDQRQEGAVDSGDVDRAPRELDSDAGEERLPEGERGRGDAQPDLF